MAARAQSASSSTGRHSGAGTPRANEIVSTQAGYRPLQSPTWEGPMGVMAPEHTERRTEIIELLRTAYWMEIETVMSYIANSTNPDGVRAQEIIEALQQDIQEELGHAQQFAKRIHELHGTVPGSQEFRPEQDY